MNLIFIFHYMRLKICFTDFQAGSYFETSIKTYLWKIKRFYKNKILIDNWWFFETIFKIQGNN